MEASHGAANRDGPDHPVLLTENQAILYFCLHRIDGETTSLSRIARETAISEHTLKSCLKKLREEQVIIYGGRHNCGGRIGFTAKVLERPIVLRGDKSRLTKKLQQIDYHALLFTETLEGTLHLDPQVEDLSHPMDHPMKLLLTDIEQVLRLDFGHSGIDPRQIRQGRGGIVRKFGEVWWRSGHHEIAQPPMPLQ